MANLNLNTRPTPDEYFEYYLTYIGLVPDGQCSNLMFSQIDELQQFFATVNESQANMVHAPFTWTIKQVVGHMIDTERVFAERLHHIAFNDLQPLNAMDQDQFISNGDYDTPSLDDLVNELIFCRQANLLLVRRIQPKAWDNRGTASGYTVTARALAWMLVGHIIYHMKIVRRRLSSASA